MPISLQLILSILPVSYPVLKDEASSVQLGFSPPASSAGSGGSLLLPYPAELITMRAMFMLELPSAERNIP